MHTLIRLGLFVATFFLPCIAYASAGNTGDHGGNFSLVFLFLIIMLVLARVGALVERIGQPAVLGELLMGVILGAVAILPFFHGMEELKVHPFIYQVAEIGVILLLFRTGLESNLGEMKKVGFRALLVAVVGVFAPFVGGFFVSKFLLPGESFNTYLFIGATLTATSVGITARVFKDLNVLKTNEAKIVLGAAVIDDVLGLLILAIVAGIVSSGSISIGTIAVLSLKAFLFLGGSILLGRRFAPKIGRIASSIHSGVGMKMALALIFCAVFAWAAQSIAGLAPIVGAFAAGLILDSVHFQSFSTTHLSKKIREWASKTGDTTLSKEMQKEADHEDHTHVEQLIDGISFFFVPIFFVYTGLQVNLSVFSNPKTVGIALAITAVAFLGKMVSGYVAGKGVDKRLIGFGMIPRGEVGLIFANVGKQIGVVNDHVFAIVVIMVILSTLFTPPILGLQIKKNEKKREQEMPVAA